MDNAQKPMPAVPIESTQSIDVVEVGDLTIDFTGAHIVKTNAYSYRNRHNGMIYRVPVSIDAYLSNGALLHVQTPYGYYRKPNQEIISLSSQNAQYWAEILHNRWFRTQADTAKK